MGLETLIGAGLGGLAGAQLGGVFDRRRGGMDPNAFGVPKFGQQYGQYSRMAGADQRVAPQASESGFRGNQVNLAAMLEAQARGEGPGQALVRLQAQQAADRAAAQQMAMARGSRPSAGPGMALGAAQNAANLQSQVGGQAAMGGLAAQLGAIDQLGGVLQGARGQDLQRNMFNADTRLRQMGLDDQRQLELLRQRLALSELQQRGQMGYQQGMLGANMMTPTGGERLLGALVGAGQMYGAGAFGGAK
jgi:hypothetical protein